MTEGRPADEAEQAYLQQVEQSLPRNYAAHVVHGLLGQTGFRLVQAPTFIEAYVLAISGSPLAVGAMRACQSIGMFLSPLLGATFIEHRRKVLPVGFLVGGVMRLQLLGLACSAFFLAGQPALLALGAFLALFGFFMGMQGVVFNFLVSKVIPVERRGRLMGLRNALAGITAGATGYLGGQLVEHGALGNGFAATFLLAFVLTSLGLASLVFVREPVPPRMREPARVGQRLRELPALLRSNRAFTRFFLARALATLGAMSVPFYTPYAISRFALGGRELGELTLAFTLAMSMGNLAWGSVADRSGFRATFITSLCLWMTSALALMSATGFLGIFCAMLGLGAGQGGFMMSSQNLVLEFGARENLPMRIAVANSASGLMGAIAPLAAGLLLLVLPYEAVFWIAIGFQSAAVVWVVVAVPDPRWRSALAGSS